MRLGDEFVAMPDACCGMSTISFTSPQVSALGASMYLPRRKRSRVRPSDDVEEAHQAGVRVDEPDLAGGMPT